MSRYKKGGVRERRTGWTSRTDNCMTGIDPRHRRDHLSLLPSGSDEVHGRLLRGDRSELSARLIQPEAQYIRFFFS